jgi:hypothetical protein
LPALLKTAQNKVARGMARAVEFEILKVTTGNSHKIRRKVASFFSNLDLESLDCFALLLSEQLPRLISQMDSMVVRLATLFSRTTFSNLDTS